MAGNPRAAIGRVEDWREQARGQLAHTKTFSDKEDGFSPLRPEASILRVAEAVIDAIKRDYLPIPYVTSSADGGITFEWRKPDSRLTINIRAMGDAGYFGFREPGHIFEGELKEGQFDFINEVVDILLVK